MLEIGITGGIGSGKTTVCKVFESFGVPVFYADTEAKEIVNTSTAVKQRIIELFGKEAFIDGVYNRKFIASKVFSNRDLLYKLNRIIHPAVQEKYKIWKSTHIDKPYVLKEAAILIETQTHKELDAIILVVAPKELKIKRVTSRDNSTVEEVLARMDKQLSDFVKQSFARYVIENDEKTPLIPKIENIHNSIIGQVVTR
ncbi:MAG: dephospho-CoA kinase [Luteibaculaceae bacterium]